MPSRVTRLFEVLLLMLGVLDGSHVLLAQENVGKIVGVVMDPSKAPIPGAQITAENLGTGAKYSATSDERGFYSIPSVRIGQYTFRASAQGFNTVEKVDMKVIAGLTVTMDFNMPIGEV